MRKRMAKLDEHPTVIKRRERMATVMADNARKEDRIKVLAVAGYAAETIARMIGVNKRELEPGGIWWDVYELAVQRVMEDVMTTQIELAKQGDDKAADRLIRRHLVGFDKQPTSGTGAPIELHLNFTGEPGPKLVNGSAAPAVIAGETARLIDNA